MGPESNNVVAVVAIGGAPSESLRQMCQRHCWLCLVASEALQVLRAVRRNRMLVVIVEVSPADARSTQLLQLLSNEASETTVIAVVAHHEDSVERDIRAAGAHWYVPNVDKTVLIERMVAIILEQRETLPSGRARSCPIRWDERVSSSSPPLMKHGRRA